MTLKYTLVVIWMVGSLFPSPFAATLGAANATPSRIASPRSGLLAVPFPELTRLDPAVAEQIQSFQESLTELAARPDASDSDLAEGYGTLGQLYQAYELFEPARTCYINAIQTAPGEFSWHHLLGFLHQKTGNLPAAVENYRMARQLQPGYAASAEQLGSVFIQLNEQEKALTEFQAALVLSQQSPAAHNGLGQLALLRKDYLEAIRHFESALEYAPDANRIHYSLAMAYRGTGDLDKANSHLEQHGKVGIRPIDPLVDGLQTLVHSERVHLINGQMAFKAGRLKQAADLYAKAIEANPQSVQARINLGVSLANMQDADGAIAQFRAALLIDLDNANAHFNLGVQLYQRKDYPEAVEHFESAGKIHPEDLAITHQLAKAWIKTGHEDRALDQLLKVTDLVADNEPVLLLLSRLLIHFERYREALDLLTNANRRFPDHGITAHELARVLAACPDLSLRDGPRAADLALSVFHAQKTPAHAETLALALAESGRCEEAANLQRQLIAAYEKQTDDETLAQYKRDLSLYEKGSPCRPAGQSVPENRR